MHKCKYIKYLYGVSPTENVYYIKKKTILNLFEWACKSGNYGQKESGQTVISDDLSAWAPPVGLEPTTL